MKTKSNRSETIGQRCARRLCQGKHLAPHLTQGDAARIINEELTRSRLHTHVDQQADQARPTPHADSSSLNPTTQQPNLSR
jgi:hypothetical protein